MVVQLETELGERPSGSKQAPAADVNPADRRATILGLRDLAVYEAAGAKHLKELAKEARSTDSQKHERVLKFGAKLVSAS
jgi:hypothetical protein